MLQRFNRRGRQSEGGPESVVEVQRMLVEVEDRDRRHRALVGRITHPVWGPTSVMDPLAPWTGESEEADGPNMLSGEERRYLRWVAARARGKGNAVELGPWLGQSTRCLLDGLDESLRLTTVDDFVWRSSWMDDYLRKTPHEAPENHASFLQLFRSINASRLERLDVVQGRFSVSDGNDRVPPFEWSGGAIELLVVDCGRNQEVNEAWFRSVRPSLLAGQTLIVMQDWRLFREVPFRWYNQTRQFTDSKASELTQLHEVTDGGLASFLFTG